MPPPPIDSSRAVQEVRIIIYIPNVSELGARIFHHKRVPLLISDGAMVAFFTKLRTTSTMCKL